MRVTFELVSPDQRRFRGGCFDNQIGQPITVHDQQGTLIEYHIYFGGKTVELTVELDWTMELSDYEIELPDDPDELLEAEWGFTTATVAYIGPRHDVEWFAGLTAEERDAVMAEGKLIQTLDDLEGLTEEQQARLRPIIEAQTPRQ